MNPDPADDFEGEDLGHTQLYGANGDVFGVPRAEPAIDSAPEVGRVVCDLCSRSAQPSPSCVSDEIARLRTDYAAMSERCHRAELRVVDLARDLEVTQQARRDESMARAYAARIERQESAEVTAMLDRQLRPNPAPAPEMDDEETVVVDVPEMRSHDTSAITDVPAWIAAAVRDAREDRALTNDPLLALADLCAAWVEAVARAERAAEPIDCKCNWRHAEGCPATARRRDRVLALQALDKIERDIAIASVARR